ncbi:MAG: hypothetical protein IT564_11740, partial [Rhodospirillales bacterium]|nr:hypothetical protein [Rhodospirillales bacterium]
PAAKTASVSVVEQIAAKKAAAKPAKKATKKAAPSKAGKCGVNMYWNKKTKKCADARDKK